MTRQAATLLFIACIAASGCNLLPLPTTTAATGSGKESTIRTNPLGKPVKATEQNKGGFFGSGNTNASGNLVSNNSGSIIANNSGSLVGIVKAPSGIIANNSGSIVANNSGSIIANNSGSYRVLSTTETPIAGIEVQLVMADGTPVLGADGKPITAKTDAEGKYSLPFSGNTANMVVSVALPSAKGNLLAFVARGESTGNRVVDVNYNSTLVMGYILGQWVKGDQAILERLPGDVEVETRTKMAAALGKVDPPAPTSLTSDIVNQTVNQLRQQDTTIDQQMEKVKKLLLLGLSDQGAGLSALSVETDAISLAVNGQGEVFYGGYNTGRVWRKDAQGLLRPYAGDGSMVKADATASLTASQPAPGDGGPATKAPVYPSALAFDAAGNLFIGDQMLKRVRKVDAAGVITTVAGQADWGDIQSVAVESGGSLLVATKYALDRINPDKSIVRVAGGTQGTPSAGSTSSLRFRGISDVTVDPANGDILVLDEVGLLLRLAGGNASVVAGNGKSGYSGDGGAAASAAISGTGSLTFAPDGALIMADLGNRRLRRIKDGQISSIAGNGDFGFKGDGGSATAASMVNPRGVRSAADGTLYIADAGFVRRVKDGSIATVIGQTTESSAPKPVEEAQLRMPRGLVYDPDTNALLISELWRVQRWNLTNNTIETVGSAGLSGAAFQEGGAPNASTLININGMAKGPNGAVYYTAEDSAFTRRILKHADGKLTTVAGGGDDCDPLYMTLDLDKKQATAMCVPSDTWAVAVKDDTVYYSFTVNDGINVAVIVAVGPDGVAKKLATVSTNVLVPGLAVSPDGSSLYIGLVSRIMRYDFATKQVTEVARDAGQTSPNALGVPTSFAFDANGTVYFSDMATSRVRRIDKASGTMTTIAGPGGKLYNKTGVDESLSGPWGIAFDKDGNLYIADSGHNQVKKIEAADLN